MTLRLFNDGNNIILHNDFPYTVEYVDCLVGCWTWEGSGKMTPLTELKLSKDLLSLTINLGGYLASNSAKCGTYDGINGGMSLEHDSVNINIE